MRKKISVAALLFSLLLALAVPVQAKAVTYYSFEEWCSDNGYSIREDYSLNDNYNYIVFDYLGEMRCFGVSKESVLYWDSPALHFNVGGTSFYDDLRFDDSTNSFYKKQSGSTKDGQIYCGSILYSGTVVYGSSSLDNIVFYPTIKPYTFEVWCADAGLSCAASSNESSSVIPYSYNDYWHIVRRSSSGQWLLTTVGNSKLQQDMQLRISEDEGNLIIYNTYSGDGTDSSSNGYLVNVRQYVYDTDGWKQLSFSTYDFRELIDVVLDLEAGTGFDDTKILAYTNTDVYSFNGYAIMHAASTEFIFNPIITITPTPTTAPGSSGGGQSGSSSRPGSGTASGGQATGGGGLDFIINLFTLIWTKICSVPMAVDGYSISLQQLFVYGALVSIIGGFIMHFIFGRK